MSIKLNYRYRDGANYKQNGHEIFSNKSQLHIVEIEEKITSALIDGEWFYASEWDLPDLHLYRWDPEIDHNFHEYDSIEETTEAPTKGDIKDFIKLILLPNRATKHFLVDDRVIRQVKSAWVPADYNRFTMTLFGPSNLIYERVADTSGIIEYNFSRTESSTLQLNQELINTNLSIVLAELLLTSYNSPGYTIEMLIEDITQQNFLSYNLSFGHPMYRMMISNFLESIIYGMKPDVVWDGIYISKGIVVTNASGKAVCYHIYNISKFIEHLFSCIRIERTEMIAYYESGKEYIKLPLHIIFTERIFEGIS